MADLNFGFSGLSNKVSVPVIGAVDGTIALLVGGIVLIVLIVLLYKILHRKKTVGAPPEHGQQGTRPAPWKEETPAEVPRRLRRRGEEMETPFIQETASTKPFSAEKSSEIARQLKGETVSATTTQQPRQRRERKGGNDLELLAGDLAEQNERDEKAKKELEELRKKLGMPPTAEEIRASPVPPLREEPEQPGERRHERWREKREEKTEAKQPPQRREHGRGARQSGSGAGTAPIVQQPTESETQLEQLKKMEFKDLLKESEEAKGEKSEEDELKELEGEEGEESLEGGEEGAQKCPNCKRLAEKILYCPECGTGFCKQCAKSFKKQGNGEFYQCPGCEAYVKAGHD